MCTRLKCYKEEPGVCRAPPCYHWLVVSALRAHQLIYCFGSVCFVFRVGVFCLLTQLKTLKTVPVQWVYKILEIGYSSLTIKDAARCQIATWQRSLLHFPLKVPWPCVYRKKPCPRSTEVWEIARERSILILANLVLRVASVWFSHVIRLNFEGMRRPCATWIWCLSHCKHHQFVFPGLLHNTTKWCSFSKFCGPCSRCPHSPL